MNPRRSPVLMSLIPCLVMAQAAPPPAPSVPSVVDQRPSDPRPVGAAGQEYRIGAGDILHVTVFGYDDLNQTVVVEPTGTFAFPMIGVVPASERTPAEVEGRIKAELGRGLIRDPQVTVVVVEYRSKVVYVVGEVTRPGTYPLAGATSVVEILSKAGPLSPSAGSEVLVIRSRGRVDQPVLPPGAAKNAKEEPATADADVFHVNLRAIQTGHLETNFLLRPNDTVFVPQSARIFVTGEVKAPGAFPFTAGLTLRQAVSLAGGFTQDASTGSGHVVRVVLGKSKTLKLGLDEPLEPLDTIVIRARRF
jgi:polysaccharide export outer membrane protein